MLTGVLTGVCGLATAGAPVSGQSVTLHFDLDGDPLTSGDPVVYNGTPVTWTVYASFTGFSSNDAYFSGFVGSFAPELLFDGSVTGSVSNLTNLMRFSGTEAVGDGTAVENVNIFQSALLSVNDSSNPLAIFSFDLSVDGVSGGDPDSPRRLRYSAEGVASLFPDGSIFALREDFEQFSIISDVLWVPGPGALGVAGIGAWLGSGLGGSRRRGPVGNRSVKGSDGVGAKVMHK